MGRRGRVGREREDGRVTARGRWREGADRRIEATVEVPWERRWSTWVETEREVERREEEGTHQGQEMGSCQSLLNATTP